MKWEFLRIRTLRDYKVAHIKISTAAIYSFRVIDGNIFYYSKSSHLFLFRILLKKRKKSNFSVKFSKEQKCPTHVLNLFKIKFIFKQKKNLISERENESGTGMLVIILFLLKMNRLFLIVSAFIISCMRVNLKLIKRKNINTIWSLATLHFFSDTFARHMSVN